MAYEYKTVLRRENHDFDVCKNKWNSKVSSILAYSRKHYCTLVIGEVNNKSNEVTFFENTQYFRKSTLEEIKKNISL